MARRYQAECTDCGFTDEPRFTHQTAYAVLRRHACDPALWGPAPTVCLGCGNTFPMLVEGTDMCLACDALYYPDVVITHRTFAPPAPPVPLPVPTPALPLRSAS